MSFSIGTVPQAIAQGYQSDVVLYNEGPDTVWVGNDTSVTSVTGFAIKPKDSMVWQRREALYAVCRALPADPRFSDDLVFNSSREYSGRSQLRVTNTGLAQVPATTSTDLLSPRWVTDDSVNRQWYVSNLNVAAYDALRLSLHVGASPSPGFTSGLPSYLAYTLWWYDSDGTATITDGGAGFMADSHIVIPCEGEYVTIIAYTNDATANTRPFGSVEGLTRETTPNWNGTAFAWNGTTVQYSVMNQGSADSGTLVVFDAAESGVGPFPASGSTRFPLLDVASHVHVDISLSGVPNSVTNWQIAAIPCYANTPTISWFTSRFTPTAMSSGYQFELDVPRGGIGFMRFTGTALVTSAAVPININTVNMTYYN